MKIGELLVTGAVTIGIITALTLNGRQTAKVATAGFGGASQFLGTAITGKKQ